MIKYLKGWQTTEGFYKAVNSAYKNMYGEYQMIHFPFYKKNGEDFFQTQKNLTDECLKVIPKIKDKNVLEIGCGNGMQGIYIVENFKPKSYLGIDINASNLQIAKEQAKLKNIPNIQFKVDNAQKLEHVEDNSIDVVLNIESAMHYPEKLKFLMQIERVLKPGGDFIVADVLSREKRKFTNWDVKMHHLNWSKEEYIEGFEKSGLELKNIIDITKPVVEGFKRYNDWFNVTALKSPIKKILIKFWAIKIFKFNIRNLESKNCYYIFSGKKSIDE